MDTLYALKQTGFRLDLIYVYSDWEDKVFVKDIFLYIAYMEFFIIRLGPICNLILIRKLKMIILLERD